MTSRDQKQTGIPTLEDVAERAGVSTATVSRCLNAPDRLAERTRDRVNAAIEALGYSPNFGARALVAKRTGTIAAVIPTMENAIFARGLQAFQVELGRHGVTLLVASSSYDPETEEAQIRALVARGADGILLIGHDRNAEIYDLLRRRDVPALVTWAYDANAPRPSIGFDNRAAMAELAARVIELGHRRIAMISGPRDGNDRAYERVTGIRHAMLMAGLDPETLTVIETSYGIERGAVAFETLMVSPNPPTAVICGNDVLAVGAVRQAQSMGMEVPGDISITGFDDIELATVVSPQLTTVQVPHREMGRQAAQMLVKMVDGWVPEASVRLDTTIKFRGTLGHAPAGA